MSWNITCTSHSKGFQNFIPNLDPSQASALKKRIWGLVVKSFTRTISHSHHHQHWRWNSQHWWYSQILNISSRNDFFNLLLVPDIMPIAINILGYHRPLMASTIASIKSKVSVSCVNGLHLEMSQYILKYHRSYTDVSHPDFFRLGFSKHSLSLFR